MNEQLQQAHAIEVTGLNDQNAKLKQRLKHVNKNLKILRMNYTS